MSHSPGNHTAPSSGWSRAILHVDMDAFYVNVHILDNPEDSGFPLAIGGKPDQRGVVASASYEARATGVRSAMPMRTAVKLCPTLKIVPADWPRIKECSRQVMDILAEFGPLEQMSVDEAYIDLSEHLAPVRLSDTIRKRLKAETGLPASVGLATNKLVAKVASDQNKPEGCTIVLPGTEARFLSPLPARVIWGIGPRTNERLSTLGIETCGQLARASLEMLRAEFGSQSEALQQRASGIDRRQVVTDRGPAKSISNEWTFDEDTADLQLLGERLEKMVGQVGKSLRGQSLVAHTVTVKFRLADFTTYTRQKTVQNGIDNDAEILRLARQIWRENWDQAQQLRLLGVGVSNLSEPEVQQLAFKL